MNILTTLHTGTHHIFLNSEYGDVYFEIFGEKFFDMYINLHNFFMLLTNETISIKSVDLVKYYSCTINEDLFFEIISSASKVFNDMTTLIDKYNLFLISNKAYSCEIDHINNVFNNLSIERLKDYFNKTLKMYIDIQKSVQIVISKMLSICFEYVIDYHLQKTNHIYKSQTSDYIESIKSDVNKLKKYYKTNGEVLCNYEYNLSDVMQN